MKAYARHLSGKVKIASAKTNVPSDAKLPVPILRSPVICLPLMPPYSLSLIELVVGCVDDNTLEYT